LTDITKVVSVGGDIAELLTRNGYGEKGAWIIDRLAILRDQGALLGEKEKALDDLNRIITGMGGLMDLQLRGTPPNAGEDRRRLDSLADALYDLIKAS